MNAQFAEKLASLTQEQRKAIYWPQSSGFSSKAKKHLLIEAGAGAGKTHVLSLRCAALCDPQSRNGVNPSRLFLVTFSRAAQRELAERVKTSIEHAGYGHAACRVHISTIDSLILSLVDAIYPHFYDIVRRNIFFAPCKTKGYAPQKLTPANKLVDEVFALEALEKKAISALQKASWSKQQAAVLCDFLLAGGMKGEQSLLPFEDVPPEGKGFSSSDTSWQKLLSSMLSEHFLRLDTLPLQVAKPKVHPGLVKVLQQMQNVASAAFAERILQGNFTYSDATLFLYNIFCTSITQKSGTLFEGTEALQLPISPQELIVDEYQDTSKTQHELLFKLASQNAGRMVVVGDSKQSIYGFRNANVEVMENLKKQNEWEYLTLDYNFRSNPDLLTEINHLSANALGFFPPHLPEAFLASPFYTAAMAKSVSPRPLLAGRKAHATEDLVPISPRIEFLSASLNSERVSHPEEIKNGYAAKSLINLFIQNLKETGEFLTDINTRQINWNKVAIICETNKQVNRLAKELQSHGIPALALASKDNNISDLPSFGCLRAFLLLLKSFFAELSANQLFEILVSPISNISFREIADFFKSSEGKASTIFFCPVAQRETEYARLCQHPIFDSPFSKSLEPIREHLHNKKSAKSLKDNFYSLLSNQFVIQLWQVVCRKILNGNKTKETHLLDTLCNSILMWENGNFRLEDLENLPTKLSHWKLVDLWSEDENESANSVSVITVHGAKGLEWDFVYFMPRKEKTPPEAQFLISQLTSTTAIKWLGGDTTSLGMLPWLEVGLERDYLHIFEDNQGKTKVQFFIDMQKQLEDLFERQRVFYTAFTRAREKLVLLQPLPNGNTRKSLRDKLALLPAERKGDYTKARITSFEERILANYLDSHFQTGYKKVSKSKKEYSEPWLRSDQKIFSDHSPHVAWTETCSPPREDQSLPLASPKNTLLFSKQSARQPAPDNSSDKETALEAAEEKEESATIKSHEFWQNITSKRSVFYQGFVIPQTEAPQENSHIEQNTPLFTDLKSNKIYERKLKSAQGVAYHALQEHLIAENDSPGRNFINISQNYWFELEVWHSAETSPLTLSCPTPKRNILDLVCYIPIKNLTEAILGKATFEILQNQKSKHNQKDVTLVLDYKTGSPKASHQKQLMQYLKLAAQLRANGFACSPEPIPIVLGALCYDLQKMSHQSAQEFQSKANSLLVLLSKRYLVTYSFLTTH